MIQEEKKLLLKDLSGRLPYGVKINVPHHYGDEDGIISLDAFWLHDIQHGRKEIKPYLRPMSSMTEEEMIEFERLSFIYDTSDGSMLFSEKGLDWLNAHHLDYRGLIPMGLALEAPKDIYKSVAKLENKLF